MEDEDEIQSHTSPSSNGRITVTVAAAPPSSNSLTLALPIQQQKTPGSGGGREDCWSEGATAVLIEAWGERYLELSRGNLKQKHWKDVADIVSSREDYSKTPKTDIQCKNRIDTVKKKYKTEKAKMASGAGPSKWRFYDRLDELIGPTPKANSSTPSSAEAGNNSSVYPMAIPVGVRSSSQERFRKRAAVEWEDESEPENSADSSDGLPPERYKIQKRGDGGKERSWGKCMRELTGAMLKFGEAYEEAESAKLQQLVEMEKQRMKFAKELELQRMHYLMKTQLELSQLKKMKKKKNGSSSADHHHGNGNGIANNNHHHLNSSNNNNSGDGDSSS